GTKDDCRLQDQRRTSILSQCQRLTRPHRFAAGGRDRRSIGNAATKQVGQEQSPAHLRPLLSVRNQGENYMDGKKRLPLLVRRVSSDCNINVIKPDECVAKRFLTPGSASLMTERTVNAFRTALLGITAAAAIAVVAQAAEINGAGATFPYPIYAKWAEAYAAKTGLKMNYHSIGSGGGIAQVKARTVDFGASDMPLKPAELEQAGLAQFPPVIGGEVMVGNLPGIQAG